MPEETRPRLQVHITERRTNTVPSRQMGRRQEDIDALNAIAEAASERVGKACADLDAALAKVG